MEKIRQYRVAIIILVPVLILVIIRSAGVNHFRPDAKKWAESSVARSNIVTPEMIKSMDDEKMLVNLDGNQNENSDIATDYKVINIVPEEILAKNNINLIRKNSGPVILTSSDPAVAVRMWMLLSQMGIRNLYILSNDMDIEAFKNEFRPDTITRPELQVF